MIASSIGGQLSVPVQVSDAPDAFTEGHASYIEGTYDCVDRLVVNAYFPLGQTPGGLRAWWQSLHGGSEHLDDEHLMRMAGRFSRRVHGWAKAHKVPIQDCTVGERKHEMAEELIPQDPNYKGIFLVQVCKAPALLWHVERKKNWFDITRKSPWPYVNHYCFHIMDPEWGHMTIRMSGHPPFGAMILLNGHEWVERRAKDHGVEFTKSGNCFTDCTDFPLLDHVADTLNSQGSIGRLTEVCDRWIYSACLCFGLDLEEQKRSGFSYAYSVYQTEYSRNLSFKRGSDLDAIYQRLVDLSRSSFQIQKVKTIFGAKRRGSRRTSSKTKARAPVAAQVTVEKHAYDLTVFRVQFGRLAVKIYDKGGRLLRIEAVAHDTRQLKCGRDIANLPKIITALRDIVFRFLNVLSWAHTAFLDQGALDELPQTTTMGARRVAGIDINKVRLRSVIQAVIALAPKNTGFRVCELASLVRQITGWDQKTYSERQAAYDLLKLRAKNIVVKVNKSRRYIIEQAKLQTISTLLILREKVIKPMLEGANPKAKQSAKQNANGAIDQHYMNLQRELHATCRTLGITA